MHTTDDTAARRRLRTLWAAVSATPGASVEQLAVELAQPVERLRADLELLDTLGYITDADRAPRPLIPFVVTQ